MTWSELIVDIIGVFVLFPMVLMLLLYPLLDALIFDEED